MVTTVASFSQYLTDILHFAFISLHLLSEIDKVRAEDNRLTAFSDREVVLF